MRSLTVFAALLFVLPAHADLSIEWVTVGDLGNAGDTEVMTCCDAGSIGTSGYGAAGYTYQIGKYPVTNAQYAEFLNAVAAIDTYGLYSLSMGGGYGGITRSGSPGTYTYSTIADREDRPVNNVSFYDSLRFANWLHNGQPTGGQDYSTTEDGAYTFGGATSVGARNAGATIFLTSEDEWYKSAYYDTALGIYYDYPAGSDTQTTCATPGATENTANCQISPGYPAVGRPTDVGSYTGSASPNATFDQGGNVWEWNEAIISGSSRGQRGGSFHNYAGSLAAPIRYGELPTYESGLVGFRVAGIPAGWFPSCGNGDVEGAEGCDDGATDPGDGCDASCEVEPGWTCEGQPSVCAPIPVPSTSATGVAVLGVAIFGIGVMGLVIAARRRLD